MIRTISDNRSTATDRMINSAASDHNINSTCNENCSIIGVIITDIENQVIIAVIARYNSTDDCWYEF